MMIKKWAGFVDDKIHISEVDDGFGGYTGNMVKMPHIYNRKSDARKRFKDVRKVKITIESDDE